MLAATLFTWGCGGDDGPGEKLEVSPEELILSENGEALGRQFQDVELLKK